MELCYLRQETRPPQKVEFPRRAAGRCIMPPVEARVDSASDAAKEKDSADCYHRVVERIDRELREVDAIGHLLARKTDWAVTSSSLKHRMATQRCTSSLVRWASVQSSRAFGSAAATSPSFTRPGGDVPPGHASSDLSPTVCNIGLGRRRDLTMRQDLCLYNLRNEKVSLAECLKVREGSFDVVSKF